MAGARRVLLPVVAVLIVVFAVVTVVAWRYQPLKSEGGAFRFHVVGADGRMMLDAVRQKDGDVFPDEGLATVLAGVDDVAGQVAQFDVVVL
jgi:hypothetical protein